MHSLLLPVHRLRLLYGRRPTWSLQTQICMQTSVLCPLVPCLVLLYMTTAQKSTAKNRQRNFFFSLPVFASISSLILELSKKFFDSLIVRCKQFFRCSFFHDHAIFHEYDMICHISCEIHLVGYDDHRHMFCRQIFDDL